MGIKNRMGKALEQFGDKGLKQLMENFKILENHIITCQENQKEFEQYLKSIEDNVIEINKKLK